MPITRVCCRCPGLCLAGDHSRNLRIDLNAAEHSIGVAFAFPCSSKPALQAYVTNASVAAWEEEDKIDVGGSNHRDSSDEFEEAGEYVI